jgi:hypothetical protein
VKVLENLEVRVEKDATTFDIRIGWSTDDSGIMLGKLRATCNLFWICRTKLVRIWIMVFGTIQDNYPETTFCPEQLTCGRKLISTYVTVVSALLYVIMHITKKYIN